MIDPNEILVIEDEQNDELSSDPSLLYDYLIDEKLIRSIPVERAAEESDWTVEEARQQYLDSMDD